jgi:hypothetical protein
VGGGGCERYSGEGRGGAEQCVSARALLDPRGGPRVVGRLEK